MWCDGHRVIASHRSKNLTAFRISQIKIKKNYKIAGTGTRVEYSYTRNLINLINNLLLIIFLKYSASATHTGIP